MQTNSSYANRGNRVLTQTRSQTKFAFEAFWPKGHLKPRIRRGFCRSIPCSRSWVPPEYVRFWALKMEIKVCKWDDMSPSERDVPANLRGIRLVRGKYITMPSEERVCHDCEIISPSPQLPLCVILPMLFEETHKKEFKNVLYARNDYTHANKNQ